ncbi:MAG: dockerin type I repeat-containing protein, partial [Clostridiales bacterium]|nr:dockerin type I repeat-containing protein [Candidatus Equinaster intestinalis]
GMQDITQDATIQLKGDLDGNGKANKSDMAFLISYLSKTYTFTDYEISVMDLNGDNRVKKSDLELLKDHIKKIEPLW